MGMKSLGIYLSRRMPHFLQVLTRVLQEAQQKNNIKCSSQSYLMGQQEAPSQQAPPQSNFQASKWSTRSKLGILVLAILVAIIGSWLLLWFFLVSPQLKDKVEIPLAQQQQGEIASSSPAVVASLHPSTGPTTTGPTIHPSRSPTLLPSPSPTAKDFLPNPIPDDPPPFYFNYDLNDEQYGPNAWTRVDMTNTYWSEFGNEGFGPWKRHLTRSIPDITKNRCGEPAKQSPVHLSPLVTKDHIIPCSASHQIRHRVSSTSFP